MFFKSQIDDLLRYGYLVSVALGSRTTPVMLVSHQGKTVRLFDTANVHADFANPNKSSGLYSIDSQSLVYN